jgi:hypothetical protein
MLKSQALAFYKTRAGIHRALGSWTPQAVYLWEEIVPLSAARKLAEASGGALSVDESLYDEKGCITAAAKETYPPPRKRRVKRKRKHAA